jgi:hypothetical protein
MRTPPQRNRPDEPKDMALVSDSLRIVCLALIVASAAILLRIALIW